MTDILKYEARRHLLGVVALTVMLGLFVLLILSLYPSIAATGPAIEELFRNLPEQFTASFAVEAYTTVEGFLASEFYQFMWLLLAGLYVVYLAGGIVADDVESGRIDLLLATPVSRRRVVVEKYLSLFVPIVVLNLVIPLFVYAGLLTIGESIDVQRIVLLHLFSIPYLAVVGALGLLLSVLVDRADIAQRGGLAVLFVLFVLDSVTTDTDFEWLGTLSPTRYFDPTAILVDGDVDLAGALLLVAAAVLLVLVSAQIFKESDV
ncbi:MAG: ABC transporter permease [Halanaeroarchaeum sp.]